MGKLITTKVTRFDGGMVNDPRSKTVGACRIVKHLDNYTDETRLTPYTDIDFTAVVEPTTAANFDLYRIQQIIYSGGKWFGLGVQSGTTKPAIYVKSNLNDAWVLGETGGDYASLTTATANPTNFILYRNYLYGIDGTGGSTAWWKYGDITGTPSWTRNLSAVLNLTSPIVHSKDDIMYYINGSGTATQQQIGTLNGTSFTANALSFGTYVSLSSLCEYENYLAIAANNPNDTTNVYLWDRDSSQTTLSVKIDWGSGTIKFIGNIGGTLVGCSVMQPAGLGINYQVVFKYYNGVEVKTFAEFTASAQVISALKQNYNNLLYFLAEMTLNGTALRGIWKIVKHRDGRLTVSFDRLPRLDDTITTGKLYGFLRTGDYFHVACGNAHDSDKYIVSKTDTTYGTSASFETTIQNGEDSSLTKKLVGISIMHEPLPSGAGVIVKYKADAESSWTQILNSTTDNDISHDAVNIESSGVNLPQYKELQLQIIPSGGAVVTGYETVEEIIDKKLY